MSRLHRLVPLVGFIGATFCLTLATWLVLSSGVVSADSASFADVRGGASSCKLIKMTLAECSSTKNACNGTFYYQYVGTGKCHDVTNASCDVHKLRWDSDTSSQCVWQWSGCTSGCPSGPGFGDCDFVNQSYSTTTTCFLDTSFGNGTGACLN